MQYFNLFVYFVFLKNIFFQFNVLSFLLQKYHEISYYYRAISPSPNGQDPTQRILNGIKADVFFLTRAENSYDLVDTVTSQAASAMT